MLIVLPFVGGIGLGNVVVNGGHGIVVGAGIGHGVVVGAGIDFGCGYVVVGVYVC